MNQKITLIGRGWLGTPLLDTLKKKGFEVFSTSTESDGSDLQFDITKNPNPAGLKINDILIYSIPPLGVGEIELFFENIHPHQKIIFISSTSIYGKNLGLVDETYNVTEETAGSPVLFSTEKFLKKKFSNLTIIRPGGLYGIKRHPAFFLAGKTGIKTGEELLHLAHLDDCISAILKIVELNIWGEDFNIVSDLRIQKKIYYQNICQKLGLVSPEYVNTNLANPTNIQNTKAKKLLKINFLNPEDFSL
jgi:nucleoside-diphosphate-sugar epimerase